MSPGPEIRILLGLVAAMEKKRMVREDTKFIQFCTSLDSMLLIHLSRNIKQEENKETSWRTKVTFLSAHWLVL